jgi:hypothetical protein
MAGSPALRIRAFASSGNRTDSWGIEWGIFAGIGIFVISRFAQGTRLGIKREFEQIALLYG